MTIEKSTAEEGSPARSFTRETAQAASALAEAFLVSRERGRSEELPPPQQLYHYTTILGFKGIIESNTLWATDVRYLNDAKELRYGKALIAERISVFVAANNDEGLKSFFEIVQRTISDIDEGINIFTASFSEVDDDLNQWRGYSAGTGICLQMNLSSGSVDACDAGILKIIYDRSKQIALIDKLLGSIIELHQQIVKVGSTFLANAECSMAFREECLYLITRFKASHWHSEREWRLVWAYSANDRIAALKHRVVNGVLVPYLEKAIRTLRHSYDIVPIYKVRIGPSHNVSLLMQSIDEYLSHHSYKGIHVNLEASSIPLR